MDYPDPLRKQGNDSHIPRLRIPVTMGSLHSATRPNSAKLDRDVLGGFAGVHRTSDFASCQQAGRGGISLAWIGSCW